MRSSKLSREAKHLIATIFILAFVFGFNDNQQVFSFSTWFANFISTLILAAVSLSFHYLIIKTTAKYYGHIATFELFNWLQIQQIRPKLIKKSKIQSSLPYYGATYTVLITLFSLGKVFVTPLTTFDVSTKSVGRRFANITQYETSIISILALLGNLALILLFKRMNLQLGVTMNTWFIIWNLVPLFSLMGAKIFFCSRALYVFTIAFFLSSLVFITAVSGTITIILALIFAVALIITYYYHVEYKRFN